MFVAHGVANLFSSKVSFAFLIPPSGESEMKICEIDDPRGTLNATVEAAVSPGLMSVET